MDWSTIPFICFLCCFTAAINFQSALSFLWTAQTNSCQFITSKWTLTSLLTYLSFALFTTFLARSFSNLIALSPGLHKQNHVSSSLHINTHIDFIIDNTFHLLSLLLFLLDLFQVYSLFPLGCANNLK